MVGDVFPLFLPAAAPQELGSALAERDRAVCERNELRDKCCHEAKDKSEAREELGQACKEAETAREERDVARKERTEAIVQRDQLLREYYQARQVRGPNPRPPSLWGVRQPGFVYLIFDLNSFILLQRDPP